MISWLLDLALVMGIIYLARLYVRTSNRTVLEALIFALVAAIWAALGAAVDLGYVDISSPMELVFNLSYAVVGIIIIIMVAIKVYRIR